LSLIELRDYQRDAVGAVLKSWGAGTQRPAVVCATGLGKSVIAAGVVREAFRGPIRRAVMLAHREELLDQLAEKVELLCPGKSIGIVKGSMDEYWADVVVASVQSLATPDRAERIEGSRIVIADECHHYAPAARTYYGVLERLGCFTPWQEGGAWTVGFTATMGRADGGLGETWQSVAYSKDIIHGIAEGYLVDVRGRRITVDGLDLGRVARSRGDFAEGALADALEAAGAPAVIAAKYRELAADRQGVLFAPNVSFAESCRDAFEVAGIRSAVITGDMDRGERAEVYRQYRERRVQVLHSCMVLTEGWDSPQTSCAVIARATESESLYIQMAGRVLRPFPGKADALILDVCGVTARNSLKSIADLSPGLPDVEEGESVTEAIRRARRGPLAARPIDLADVDLSDVEMFKRSPSLWLRTARNGRWFIPAGDAIFFLWPKDRSADTWMVGRYTDYDSVYREGTWLHDKGLSQSIAMGVAEAAAREYHPKLSQRSAAWRQRRQPPSPSQAAVLASYRAPVPATKSEASDLICVIKATQALGG
jgi:superfamily II DNA or RNA helicase